MKSTATITNDTQTRNYPCLLIHLGAIGGGAGSWKGIIVLARDENNGTIIHIPAEANNAGRYVTIGSEVSEVGPVPFKESHWAIYSGQVTLAN